MTTMAKLRTGLIGANIGKTRYPAALQIMCDDAGIDLEFSLIDTAGQTHFSFDEAARNLIAKDWSGVGVTHPYKLQAARFSGNGMHPDIRHLSACNLLTFHRGTVGHNTDYAGFLGAWLHEMGDRKPGVVAMAGAGGVAHALGPALVQLGAEQIHLWDPDGLRAEDLAGRIGKRAHVVSQDAIRVIVENANGLVNATALGMEKTPGSSIPLAWIGKQGWAFDAVYTPTDTLFLAMAKAAGLQTLSGFALFKHMAMASFEAYTGIKADRQTTLAKLDVLRPE
ncbi:MAG: hypothetical protein P1V21_02000 [Rhizobiaceae bacterium]|nr:hypothetical protein [Rhizobiaceae bacterium]